MFEECISQNVVCKIVMCISKGAGWEGPSYKPKIRGIVGIVGWMLWCCGLSLCSEWLIPHGSALATLILPQCSADISRRQQITAHVLGVLLPTWETWSQSLAPYCNCIALALLLIWAVNHWLEGFSRLSHSAFQTNLCFCLKGRNTSYNCHRTPSSVKSFEQKDYLWISPSLHSCFGTYFSRFLP